MNQPILQITSEPIGLGQERACYLHPDDASRVIKLQRGEVRKQTNRELRFYKNLSSRKMTNFAHLPKFYGLVETNLGEGFVVDFVNDFDGQASKSLFWYFQQGYPVSEFLPYLEELKQYLLDNQVVFSVDMGRFNILFRKLSQQQARLVIIDGLGNHTAFNWLDELTYFARKKINRRWQRFIDRLQNYSAEMSRQQKSSLKKLPAEYRKET